MSDKDLGSIICDAIRETNAEAIAWATSGENVGPYSHDVYVAQTAINGTLSLLESKLRVALAPPNG